jgi:hypothetical protein
MPQLARVAWKKATYIHVDEALSSGTRRPDIFLGVKVVSPSIDVKHGLALLLRRLVQVAGEPLDRLVEGDVAPVVATDDRLPGEVGDENGRRHHLRSLHAEEPKKKRRTAHFATP